LVAADGVHLGQLTQRHATEPLDLTQQPADVGAGTGQRSVLHQLVEHRGQPAQQR
jgi:hypothetical protein